MSSRCACAHTSEWADNFLPPPARLFFNALLTFIIAMRLQWPLGFASLVPMLTPTWNKRELVLLPCFGVDTRERFGMAMAPPTREAGWTD